MQSLDAAATVASFIFKSHIIYTHHLIHSADTDIAPFSRRGPHNRTMYAVRYIRYTMLQIWDSFGAGRGRRAFPFSVLFCFFIFFFFLCLYTICVCISSAIPFSRIFYNPVAFCFIYFKSGDYDCYTIHTRCIAADVAAASVWPRARYSLQTQPTSAMSVIRRTRNIERQRERTYLK